MIGAIIHADLKSAARGGGGAASAAVWFLLSVVFFAIALGPAPADVAKSGSAVIWASALFAAATGFERIIEQDREDGTLSIIIESGASLTLYAVAKAMAHFLVAMVPMLLAAPIAAILVGLSADEALRLLATLAIGAPALSLYGTLAGGLAAGVKRASVLMALLTAPLLAPTLIFGTAAAKDGGPAFLLLGAATLFALAIAPLAAAAALRNAD
jgi:heme exporter protein B